MSYIQCQWDKSIKAMLRRNPAYLLGHTMGVPWDFLCGLTTLKHRSNTLPTSDAHRLQPKLNVPAFHLV